MASALWQGNWITRTRITTGLVLLAYAFFHFINIGLGLLSPEWMDDFQDARQVITRSLPGSLILYAALILHPGLALWNLAKRRTLKMRWGEALQTVLGLLIPLQLLAHVVFTRYSHEIYGVNDEYPYQIVLMWASPEAWQQSLLLLAVWIHGCMGLHYWLRLTRWWRPLIPWMAGLAVFIPGFALAGFLTEGRRIHGLFVEGTERAALMEDFNWPSQQAFAELFEAERLWLAIFLLLLGLTAAAFILRKLVRRRRAVAIRYAFGPEIRAERGMTLLEMSHAGGVQHTSLCGGKGRCTTCRVVVDQGGETLPPPAPPEARSLARVQAPANMRLACQIRPQAPLTVTRMFRPDGRKGRAHASQGTEQQLAILFLDIRGFTARAAGQLPYDVVFLLNRFFDAIVPAITSCGGTVDKYLGDGLLALFEAANPGPFGRGRAGGRRRHRQRAAGFQRAAGRGRRAGNPHRHRRAPGRAGAGRDRQRRPRAAHHHRRQRQRRQPAGGQDQGAGRRTADFRPGAGRGRLRLSPPAAANLPAARRFAAAGRAAGGACGRAAADCWPENRIRRPARRAKRMFPATPPPRASHPAQPANGGQPPPPPHPWQPCNAAKNRQFPAIHPLHPGRTMQCVHA